MNKTSISTLILPTLLALGINFLATPLTLADGPPSDSDLLQSDYFDQGKAEFNVYDATILQYGEPREGTVTHVWVKEPWDARQRIKYKGEGSGDFEVIKGLQIRSFPTGIYRYEQMWSGFWNRSDGELEKFTMTHHEACGSTFKQGLFDGDRADLVTYSYMTGDSRDEVVLPEEVLFYDELPFRLRFLAAGVRGEEMEEFPLIPTTIHSRGDGVEAAPARIRETRRGDGEVEFEIAHQNGTDRMVFETDAPYKLLRWEQADGSTLQLRESRFIEYWNQTRPGDELR